MLIIGAKGLAKEILQILEAKNKINKLVFFDDININDPRYVYDNYLILRTDQEIKEYFKQDNRFALGIGNPKLRKKLCDRFEKLGGMLSSVTDKTTTIGNYTVIEDGCILMAGVKISNGVNIGKALLAYYDVVITHDVSIGDYVELSPGSKLLGHVKVEDEVHIGSGAIILPKLKIGKGSIIGAGAIVTKDVKPGFIVVGNPARELIRK
jgi:sugar O-acyltransferase (sialic acid O-acetyltransferase NeuD family)